MQMKLKFVAMALLLTSAGSAFAQAPPTLKTPAPETAPPNIERSGAQNCAPTRAMPDDGTIAPRDTTTGQATEPLGDKLAKSDGVLCPPPNVDPQMHAPAPNVGKMPVIPPPGSPGGDPTIRPK
ncbi:MAG: hypothetical protein HY242_02980 [Afipia sp.]|nr:hypothetical protein [Afipia sp.]